MALQEIGWLSRKKVFSESKLEDHTQRDEYVEGMVTVDGLARNCVPALEEERSGR